MDIALRMFSIRGMQKPEPSEEFFRDNLLNNWITVQPLRTITAWYYGIYNYLYISIVTQLNAV